MTESEQVVGLVDQAERLAAGGYELRAARVLDEAQGRVEAARQELVREMRSRGRSWQHVGQVLGTTGPLAEQLYGAALSSGAAGPAARGVPAEVAARIAWSRQVRDSRCCPCGTVLDPRDHAAQWLHAESCSRLLLAR